MSEDIEELARFRLEWQAEVESRRRQTLSSTVPAPPAISADPKEHVEHAEAVDGASAAPHIFPRAERTSIHAPTVHRSVQSAVEHYRAAVLKEQRGELDDALQSYRLAFRMEPQVDKMYLTEEKKRLAAAPPAPTRAVSIDLAPRYVRALATEEISAGLARLHVQPVVLGKLASIVKGFPLNLAFDPPPKELLDENGEPVQVPARDIHGKGKGKGKEPEVNDEDSVPIRLLPEELLVYILQMLDAPELERFAAVNRKSRVLTLDSAIWRELVFHTYRPPQLPSFKALEGVIGRFSSPDTSSSSPGDSPPPLSVDYRRLYVEQPRVRLDGVYIAVCHYIRAGLSENQWVQISHLITYHRYLRFYSNGQVLSLLANEDLGPQEVVPVLTPALRMKGFFVGTWHLEGEKVYIENLVEKATASNHDKQLASFTPVAKRTAHQAHYSYASVDTTTTAAKGHHHQHKVQALVEPANQMIAGASSPPSHGSVTASATAPSRYVFRMVFDLRSRPVGRWNKLEWESYASVERETGNVSAFPLRNERSFWFSKVRSYAP